MTDGPIITLRSVLFGEADATAEITDSLNEVGVLGAAAQASTRLRDALGDAVSSRAGAVIAGLLDTDVLDVMKLGWQKHERLRAAGQRTLVEPGSEELVDLMAHTIRSTHEPRLEVYFDDALIATVGLRLELRADVHAVVAVVAEGRLIAVSSGKADLGAELSCEGVPIKAITRTIDLEARFELSKGISLVDPGSAESPIPG